MTKWRATLPKEAPKDGMCHVVYSYRDEEGHRVEFTGQLSKHLAQHHMENIISD